MFQTHLVCVVPPYVNSDITSPANVNLFVTSSNKRSESHNFLYTPIGSHGNLLMSSASGSVIGSAMQTDLMQNHNQGIYEQTLCCHTLYFCFAKLYIIFMIPLLMLYAKSISDTGIQVFWFFDVTVKTHDTCAFKTIFHEEVMCKN